MYYIPQEYIKKHNYDSDDQVEHIYSEVLNFLKKNGKKRKSSSKDVEKHTPHSVLILKIENLQRNYLLERATDVMLACV